MIKNPYPSELLHNVFNEGVKATIKYLEEPCKDHTEDVSGYIRDWDDGTMDSDDDWETAYYKHRNDCPDCVAEIHEELGQ